MPLFWRGGGGGSNFNSNQFSFLAKMVGRILNVIVYIPPLLWVPHSKQKAKNKFLKEAKLKQEGIIF